MADELRKDDPAIAPARVPGTKEVASRENDVIAGDDELAERKTENVRAEGDTEEAAPRGPSSHREAP